MLASALDPRQQELLMTLNETLKNEENENKINQILTRDKVHSNNFEKREVTMNKINREVRKPQRREIWNINLGNPQGSLQKGVRPCLVDSNNINNKYSNVINVYPLTSQIMTKAKIPVHVEVEGYGLKEKSIILIEQGVPIDIRFQLLDYIGTVDDLIMKKVDMARNIQHGDLQQKTPLEYLPQNIQDIINDKLEDIRSIERTICNVVRNNEFLKNDLLDEKECHILSLQRICKKYDIDYKDYYTVYKKEEEKIIV